MILVDSCMKFLGTSTVTSIAINAECTNILSAHFSDVEERG